MTTLSQLCDLFVKYAHQYSWLTPKIDIKVFDPIPPALIHKLKHLTLSGKLTGMSNMSSALRHIKEKSKVDFIAIVGYSDRKDIVGWSMLSPSRFNDFTVDVFINPEYRQLGLGDKLLEQAKALGISKGWKYYDTAHFKPYKNPRQPTIYKAEEKNRAFYMREIKEWEEEIEQQEQHLIETTTPSEKKEIQAYIERLKWSIKSYTDKLSKIEQLEFDF